SQDIGDEHVMVTAERIACLREGDKVTRYEPRSLVYQLIEGVLSVGPWFTPVDRTSVKGHRLPIDADVFAVALHGQLLEICGESLQILLIWKNSDRLGAEEVVVPNREKAHQHRKVSFEGSGAEVLVHLMETVEHRPEVVGANGQHRRQSNRRVHRISAAHPVPETEHVGCIDAKLGNFRSVG